MYSDGDCHLYSLDCPTLRDSCPFSSSGPIYFCFPESVTNEYSFFFRFSVNLHLVQQLSYSWTSVSLNWAVIYSTFRALPSPLI